MASVPIKFRCGQCKQLIGVARSKAGTVVSCPRCAAKLVAPEPDDAPEVAAPGPAHAAEAEGDGTGISLESLDIRVEDMRVEDIRVEPAVRGFYPEAPPPAFGWPSEATEERVATEPESPPPLPPLPPAPPPPPPPPVEEVRSVPQPAPARAPAALAPQLPEKEMPIFPEIRLEPPEHAGRSRRVEPARVYDVVLPRAAVASWSLLVLMAVGFAFVAGLLVGHYVWRVH
jgi:DNA-directed RNA polymerase subunit RPC12/RpoP